MRVLRTVVFLLIIFTFFLLVGCEDDEGVPGVQQPVQEPIAVTLEIQPVFETNPGAYEIPFEVGVYDEIGDGVPGMFLEFVIDPPVGEIANMDTVTDINGIHEAVYIGEADESFTITISASVSGWSNLTAQAAVEILVVEPMGVPYEIVLDGLSVEELFVNGISCVIQASVLDSNGIGVGYQQVDWSTTLGSIISPSITDAQGHTFTILEPGLIAGDAEVTGIVNDEVAPLNFELPIYSAEISLLELSTEYEVMDVTGVGGIEANTVTAIVKDGFNTNVPDGIKVLFQMTDDPPEGAYFGNGTHIDSAFTSEGTASVEFISGTGSGLLVVSASVDHEVYETTETVTDEITVNIKAGPPDEIVLNVSSEGQEAGENIFGALLGLDVTVYLSDLYGNQVEPGTEVDFAVGPDPAISPWYGAGHADIEETIMVEEEGLINTMLYYNSENTYSMVDLKVEAEGLGGAAVSAEADSIMLPLFEGRLELTIIPNSFYFTAGSPVAVLRCSALLFDGFDNPVNNALLGFSNDNGMFFCCDSMTAAQETLPPDWYPGAPPYWRFSQYTGPNPPDDLVQSPWFNQDSGEALMFMRAQEEASSNYPGVFLDPITPEMIMSVHIYLIENPEISSDPIAVTFRRDF